MSPVDQTAEIREYAVQGMTCSHCVLSMPEVVSEVSGVAAVDVDLAAGRLAIRVAEVDERALRAAVADAGYEVIA